eukprot:360663-Chlamydomonas_euryale.AAC.11
MAGCVQRRQQSFSWARTANAVRTAHSVPGEKCKDCVHSSGAHCRMQTLSASGSASDAGI